jgi:hypothetical protein
MLTPPAAIEDMKVLYYADVRPFNSWLKKYMQKVPDLFVLVYWPEDKSYCILGTAVGFDHWDQYTNYSFKELQPALELPDTIFRIPDDFRWIKVQVHN